LTRLVKTSILTARNSPAVHVLLLAGVNAFICRRLFLTEYLDRMGSIEAAYIGLSRWILEHPLDLTWFPLWYGGIPFQNAYPPLLHSIVALAAAALSVTPALAHHLVGAAAYCLGPITLYWLASTLSGRRGLSLAAALGYSLLSPSAMLVPAIARDLGTVFGPRRLHALVAYGEGPHVMALALLPAALVLLHRALEQFKPGRVFLAALALAAVPLTNWLGAFALAVAVVAYLLAYGDWRRPAGLFQVAGVALLAYALAAPWIPPSTLAAIRHNAQYTVGHYPMGGAQYFSAGLLLAAAVALSALLRRRGVARWLIFFAVFSLAMAAIALSGYWFGVYLMPQPERYHLEMDLALAVPVAFLLASALMRLPERWRQAAMAAALIGAAVQLDECAYQARNWIRPIDIRRTVEFEVARWLQENLPGRRVFATGSIKFWLNAFADNPQLGGGFDQGIVNAMIPKVTFGIPFTEGDGERCARWLRVYGIDAAVVSGPNTRDAYRDYRDADKFRGLLPELWRSGDDVIYAVPRRSPSLAHIVWRDELVARAPYNIEDAESIAAYAAALEDEARRPARFTWRSAGQAAIEAELSPEQLISVQVSYHPGWRAVVNGVAVPVRGDGLGWMVIEPACSGDCTVRLHFDGGAEMALARLAQLAAVAAALAWWARRRTRARRQN
jgi:hypothetical protein